jgi:hypothetical protein
MSAGQGAPPPDPTPKEAGSGRGKKRAAVARGRGKANNDVRKSEAWAKIGPIESKGPFRLLLQQRWLCSASR